MKGLSVTIIGGGIGGMTTALALLEAGYHVALYEQAPEFGEVGAGIMLTPNASRVLIHLGLRDPLDKLAMRPPASMYRRFDTGEVLGRSPLGDTIESEYGAPHYHIHRADLHQMLTGAVRNLDADCLHTNHRLVDLTPDADGVTATFAGGVTARGEVLIGCDGARSTVRSILIDVAEPNFRGQVAWRGLVPADGLPKTVVDHDSVVWIGTDRHIVHYPLRAGSVINYVAIAAKDHWEEEGWNRPAEVNEVTQEFSGWHDDVVQLLDSTPPNDCFKWGLFDREPLESWTKDRCALLGDAAHPMLPFMAQGSAMAIEDALVLSRSFRQCSSVSDALVCYERARGERTAQVILQSRMATTLYQRISGNKVEERSRNLDSLYGYNAIAYDL